MPEIPPKNRLTSAYNSANSALNAIPLASPHSPSMLDLIDNAIDALGDVEKFANFERYAADIRQAERAIANAQHCIRGLLGLPDDAEIPKTPIPIAIRDYQARVRRRWGGTVSSTVGVHCHTCGETLNHGHTSLPAGLKPLLAELHCPVSEWNGKTGIEVLPQLQSAIAMLKQDIDEYRRTYDDPDNWSRIDFVLPFLETMRDACCRDPYATISA